MAEGKGISFGMVKKDRGYREEEDGELKRGGIGDMKGGQSR